MDPLSDVLSLLKPQSFSVGGLEFAPDSAIQWPKHEGIKCYAMVSVNAGFPWTALPIPCC